MRHLAIAIIAVVLAAPVSARAATSPTHTVPCAVFGLGAAATCDSPFIEGVVDGQWIGLVMDYSGTNGFASKMWAYAVGAGNGPATESLGTIEALTAGGSMPGDRLWPTFRHGKMYVVNAIYLAGQAHCCNTKVVVRRYGFHDRKLTVEAQATVASSATQAQVDAALGH